MNDSELIQLLFERDERAIGEIQIKYAAYCRYIAGNILSSQEDIDEVLNDALGALWQSIPPNRPESLKAYLGRITRNLAIDKAKKMAAQKRGGNTTQEVLDELKEAATQGQPEQELDAKQLGRLINGFAAQLEQKQRVIFVKRYWYLCSSKQIAGECGISVNSVNTTLHRLRKQLKKYLEQEGYDI